MADRPPDPWYPWDAEPPDEAEEEQIVTRGEREVLEDVAKGARRGPLSKTYFDTFPAKRKIAKDLMWRGLIESGGDLGDCVCLTPAGEYAFQHR